MKEDHFQAWKRHSPLPKPRYFNMKALEWPSGKCRGPVKYTKKRKVEATYDLFKELHEILQ